MEEFDQAKEDLKGEIDDAEGPDIKEDMVKKRREWVDDFRANHQGKIPDDLKGFYEKDKVEAPLTPEQEEAKKLEEEEAAKAKKNKKKAPKKKGKKGKGAKDDKE
jgi:CO dehydrogenase/acetyl-CoA synthase alpha subunit